ncbi:hypothetical protein [Allorhizocola rhizosphaerae]|uniref:hypothetical protein n=1 Tax=Allorhizocola rhizosphaerae TaxID=1872709 RepID=UPI000E3C5800|nr:hypothetical protein [Allorhizocola rhizosphaerae]
MTPDGYQRLDAAISARPGVIDSARQHAFNAITRIMISKGGVMSSITAGDCAQYWHTRRDLGLKMHEGSLYYQSLFDLGIFGPHAPPNLTAATRHGRLSCEEIVDRYQIAHKPFRDLLVAYLAMRRPSMDYTSLTNIANNLGRLFWKDLEEHHPGIDSMHLPPEVAQAWKQRLTGLVLRPNGTGQRKVPQNAMMHVRAFYADIAHWAIEDPARWAPFAAPCPVRAADTSLVKTRKRRKAEMDQRTRLRAPVLATLLSAVERERHKTAEHLAAASATPPGGTYTHDGDQYARLPSGANSLRVFARNVGDGSRHDVTFLEDRAFWCWAVVETLRHTGIRIEELLELTHHSFCTYTLPTTGEVVPMLQIAPSKTDTERLLLVSPELGEVLAAVINRVRAGKQRLPLVSLWDVFERQWSPLMPFLFQRIAGGVSRPITRRFVSNALEWHWNRPA